MNTNILSSGLLTLFLSLAACDSRTPEPGEHLAHGAAEESEPVKGPHGGRLLGDGDFALELAIFETGVPPEYRVWASWNGAPLPPSDVELRVKLTRLGGRVDDIGFAPGDGFLRGDTVVYEPHSFEVSIRAEYRGETYTWQYENFEGRTRIAAEIADAFGLETEIAGPAVIRESVVAYGQIVANPERVRSVSARFDGVIRAVDVSVGETVVKGQILAVIESDESLNAYEVTAPIAGVVTRRNASAGEQTSGRILFTIMDNSSVWAELAVFPGDFARVAQGDLVTIGRSPGENIAHGIISQINVVAEANQAVLARVVLDNAGATLVPGMFVTGEIVVAEHEVPLAVQRTGLQAFRDFTVVYAKVGEQYEVRMLELGRQDSDRVEVLGGLEPGTEYVTTHSYLVKADIEKSGASHDH
jgi:membrane fusion protein, heavy metal efflux system